MDEIWKDIPDYIGYYQVSNLGRIKSTERVIFRSDGKIQTFKSRIINASFHGYFRVSIYNSKKKKVSHLLHRLIAITFLPNPDNKGDVNHKDGNRRNNLLSNLEWNTRLENIRHSIYQLGNTPNKTSKLKEGEIKDIKQMCSDGIAQWVISKKYGVTQSSISNIITNKTWSKKWDTISGK